MKIRNLRFFVAVIEFGGVTQAAEQLHVSQPAVSAGLKALEDELGEPLFERSGGRRRMLPTFKALRFHQKATDILERCDTAIASFRTAEARVPIVRIGVLRTISAEAITAVLTSLSQKAEHKWQIREGRPEELARWLRQGRIDIAWTTVESQTPNTHVLWHEPFVVFAAHDHPLARHQGRAITLRDLDGERLVLRGSCELKRGQLQAAGVKVRVAARADRDILAMRLVAKGFGLALAPRSLMTGDITPVLVADLDLSRTIGLRWRAESEEQILRTVHAAVLTFGRPEVPV
jgi:DNA-binding transcriptional LysR family regulator